MPSYKEMYIELFNAVTDAILILQRAQRECEVRYMDNTSEDTSGEEVQTQKFMKNE